MLYNAIISRKKKQKLTLFSSTREVLQSAILFILSTAANKSYGISFLWICFVIKLDLNRLSVCLRDVLSRWRQMTSRNVLLLTSLVRLHQNRNAVFIWSVEMCFIFVEQINVIFMRPLTTHLFCVIAL